MVGTDGDEVERDLLGGCLRCPRCGGVLGPWGHARRRVLRCRGGTELIRPRRAKCRWCGTTHVLLPDSSFIRRRDHVETIGEAIVAKAAGSGHRRIAEALGLLPDIVRGWLRAFARAAEVIRAHFTRWAQALDPLLGPIEGAGDAVGDAVAAIGVATRAAVLAFGPRLAWSAVSWMTGGALLCHTSCPFPPVP